MSDVKVKFKDHAKDRVNERGLDRGVIEDICAAAAPMLTGNEPIRFRVGGNVVVAKKRDDSTVEVVTAWEDSRPVFATKPKKKKQAKTAPKKRRKFFSA